jgi:hypothetical protein
MRWLLCFVAMLGCTGVAHAEDENEARNDRVFLHTQSLVPGLGVYLTHVVVRGKSGNLMRVGDRRREIFVAPIDPSWMDFLPIGSIVDLRGTVRETPSAGQAHQTYAAGWPVARQLARNRFYIEAWAISSPP